MAISGNSFSNTLGNSFSNSFSNTLTNSFGSTGYGLPSIPGGRYEPAKPITYQAASPAPVKKAPTPPPATARVIDAPQWRSWTSMLDGSTTEIAIAKIPPSQTPNRNQFPGRRVGAGTR